MPGQTAHPDWCSDWDRLSQTLVRELSRDDFDVDAISKLVHDRQRLMASRPSSRDAPLSKEQERAWLEHANDREAKIRALSARVFDQVRTFVASAQSAREKKNPWRSGSNKREPQFHVEKL